MCVCACVFVSSLSHACTLSYLKCDWISVESQEDLTFMIKDGHFEEENSL